jgi:hypothetical protein
MQRRSKSAAVRRLEFAVAELEVVGEIAKREGDAILLEQLYTLTDRVRDCINGMSKGNQRAVCPCLGRGGAW